MRKRRSTLGLVFASLLVGLAPGSALATAPNNEAAAYEWHLEVPNVAMAPNGDTVGITGTGTFSTHPKSATGGGSFTHTLAGGGTVTGTYTVAGLVDFQPYGCGVVFGTPIPADLCGGRLVMRVALVPDANPTLSLKGLLTIYCLIGAPPPSAEEGIRLVVPGVVNFNDVVTGENVYIKTP
jgi:hypothetical protein